MDVVVTKKEVKEIYSEYFKIIDSFFGGVKHYLGNDSESHINLGYYISSYPLISDLILDSINELDIEIDKFWTQNAKKVFNFIKSENSLKCVYSGDISPVSLENFVKKTALYVDSIIIPDPIFNLSLFNRQTTIDKKYYLNKLIRHVFNVWKLKDLILADTDESIIHIIPINLELINEGDRKLLHTTASTNFINYFNRITSQKFLSLDEILGNIESLKTNQEVFDFLNNKNDVPTQWKTLKSFDKFMDNFLLTKKNFNIGLKTTGWNFVSYLSGQFLRVQEHKFFCDKLVAEPIYDYDLPWFFFNYQENGLDMDASIINALQRENFEWIGNVPLNAIKVLREEKKLNYMRQTLRQGITDLKAKNDSDLIKVSEQLELNFKEAFKQQNAEIKTLRKEVSTIIKKEIPITTGGTILGFIPFYGIPISLVAAGRDIKNKVDEMNSKNKKIGELKNNFINLLVSSYEKK